MSGQCSRQRLQTISVVISAMLIAAGSNFCIQTGTSWMSCDVWLAGSTVAYRGLLTSGRKVCAAWEDAYIVGGSSSPDEGDFDGQQRQDSTE
jgi:hypothetical protein